MARKDKTHIPGPAHNLGDPQTARLWEELREVTAERDRLRERVNYLEGVIATAHEVADEYAAEHAADRYAREAEEKASLKAQLAVAQDLAKARR